MSKGIFITGTGTDIGKTYVTGLIVKKLRESGADAAYYKAAMSGNERRVDGSLIPGDALQVKTMSGIGQPLEEMCPYVYETAVSPHLASRLEGNPVQMDRVLEVISIADKACRDMGIAKPRIGVAGLNPHCGEGGLFGREEIDEIAPAIEAARIAGIDAQGPIPPDTIFSKAIGGWYDIVVAMYHDQGHIPLKVVGFVYDREKQSWSAVEGVNITLGLPIIRTSVDHGTAFDQAGTGKANELSLKNAIEYAVRFAANR